MKYLKYLRTLAPFAQGLAGAALILALYLGGTWTAHRWQEFKVMRSVISQLLEQSQKAATAQKSTPAQ